MKKAIILTLLITLSYSANAQNWWNSKKVHGNGNVITKTRTISEFDKVSLGGSFKVVLISGKEEKLTIKGEENILPYIETEVKNGRLKIKVQKYVNIKPTEQLIVTVPFEDINGISIGGSGDVVSKKVISADTVSLSIGGSGNIKAEVDADEVKVSIGGSGNVKLQGTAQNLKCSIAGSGDVKAYKLKTEKIKVSVAGSGDVYTTVSKKIKGSMVGSGNIYYKGNPKNIDISAVGSGKAVDRN